MITTIHVHKFIIESRFPGVKDCACGWSSRILNGTFTVTNEHGKVMKPEEW